MSQLQSKGISVNQVQASQYKHLLFFWKDHRGFDNHRRKLSGDDLIFFLTLNLGIAKGIR